jgi:hypothetical protein
LVAQAGEAFEAGERHPPAAYPQQGRVEQRRQSVRRTVLTIYDPRDARVSVQSGVELLLNCELAYDALGAMHLPARHDAPGAT